MIQKRHGNRAVGRQLDWPADNKILPISEMLNALAEEITSVARDAKSDKSPSRLYTAERFYSTMSLRIAETLFSAREKRRKYLSEEFFGEPCWDILLFLFAAREKRTNVTVSSLCLAAQVPQATALRYITKMEKHGDIVRVPDAGDRRITFIRITDSSADALKSWLSELTKQLMLIGPVS